MTIRALLFDIDGTVADTENLGHRHAYNRAFRKLGLAFRWTPRLYRKLLQQSGGRERLLHYLRHYRPELGSQAAEILRDVTHWADRVHRLKTRYFRSAIAAGKVPLRPGVHRLISEAKAQGLKVALVSNASPETISALIDHSLAELAPMIDLVVSGADVPAKKPSPDGYLQAAHRLGLHPDECVAIEDSSMGLQAAAAAGITTIVTHNSNTLDDDFSAAALVLDALGEPDRPCVPVRGRIPSGCHYLRLADIAALARRR